jgi:hypothetical protein
MFSTLLFGSPMGDAAAVPDLFDPPAGLTDWRIS